jgi:predicted nucleic acid-binding Zn ribbon protein
MTGENTTFDDNCTDCGAEVLVRQSWTGQPYTLCPNCNARSE